MENCQPDGQAEAPTEEIEDPVRIEKGLRKIRRRRWLVWSVILVYLPTMCITEEITHSFNKSLPVFFAWFLVLLVVMTISAVVRCPRCGNYYHVNGMSLLYLRRCLHCQLHLTADKQRAPHPHPDPPLEGEGT